MHRTCRIWIVLVMIALLLGGCRQTIRPGEDIEIVADAVALAHGGQFLEEWSQSQNGVTTYYRRYLVYGSVNTRDGEHTAQALYVSVPVATKDGDKDIAFIPSAPDVAGLATPAHQTAVLGARNLFFDTALKAGESGWYSLARLLLLEKIEERNEYTLLGVLDVLAKNDHRVGAVDFDGLLCVPIFGAQVLEATPWATLAEKLPMDFMEHYQAVQYATGSEAPATQIEAAEWVDEQKTLLEGRFTQVLEEEVEYGTVYARYTFEVENVLKGEATEQTMTVRIPYALRTQKLIGVNAYVTVDLIRYDFPEPQIGKTVVIAVSEESLTVGGVLNVMDEHFTARQWEAVAALRSQDAPLRAHLVPQTVTRSELKAWVVE